MKVITEKGLSTLFLDEILMESVLYGTDLVVSSEGGELRGYVLLEGEDLAERKL